MKTPKGNFFKMPKGLLTDYKLTPSELYLYYTLKELEDRFCNGIISFHTSDKRLMLLTGFSHNTLAKSKRGLKEKGLIKVRKRYDNECDYILNELDNYNKNGVLYQKVV